jgi:hypothetical protein
LSRYLADRRDSDKRSVDQITSIEDLDNASARLRSKARIVVPVLNRTEADFQVEETAEGMAVKLVVPFEGDAALLMRHFAVERGESLMQGLVALR